MAVRIVYIILYLIPHYEPGAPLQLVMDKGTEVGDMIRAQQFLRWELLRVNNTSADMKTE